MKTIKMQFGANVYDFRVTFECEKYSFMECDTNPAARGFFTSSYIAANKK